MKPLILTNGARKKRDGNKGAAAAKCKVAVIYCRVAANQVRNDLAFASQEASCVQYALSLGYVVGRVTKEVSNGIGLQERPLLEHDLSDVRRRLFDAFIVYSPDRLSRDPQQVARLALECEQAEATLLFVVEQSSKPDEYLLRQINETFMRREEEFIRQRLRKQVGTDEIS